MQRKKIHWGTPRIRPQPSFRDPRAAPNVYHYLLPRLVCLGHSLLRLVNMRIAYQQLVSILTALARVRDSCHTAPESHLHVRLADTNAQKSPAEMTRCCQLRPKGLQVGEIEDFRNGACRRLAFPGCGNAPTKTSIMQMHMQCTRHVCTTLLANRSPETGVFVSHQRPTLKQSVTACCHVCRPRVVAEGPHTLPSPPLLDYSRWIAGPTGSVSVEPTLIVALLL